MLRLSSARDASTCLRCNLRLVLRQIQNRRYQSSDESPLPLRHGEFPTPASEQQQDEQQSRPRVVRTHANHGRIRGKRGGQRRVESSEALSIASLGQSSEVIVLRDLHEPKPPRKPLREQLREQEADDDEPKVLALTASDIEAMSSRRAVRSPPSEVFESIEALRPDEGIYVVTKGEFDAKLTALAKGYNISQLRGYLYQKTAPANLAKSNATKSRRARDHMDATEISSTHGELQQLKRTPWHPGTTPATKRLPMTRFAADGQFAMGRKMNNKEFVIQSILREGWALGIEEEQAAIGETELILSPMQFGLLLTKNSETLRPLLESSKFYKNSRFQLFQADHIIRIIGPRAEAEAIAFVLTEAFAPARSADIGLDTFHSLLQDDPFGYRLPDIFDSSQLRNIMDLTKTYIRYDDEAKRLQIASFVDVAINDAHRLLVALLPLNTRGTTTLLHHPHGSDDCRLDPIPTTTNLPSYARHRQLGRWVTSSPRVVKSSMPAVADPISLGLQEGDAKYRPPVEPTASRTPLAKDSPIITQALSIMEKSLPTIEIPTLPDGLKIWPMRPRTDFWKARIGQTLHDTRLEETYPGADGITSTSSATQDKYAKPVFSPQFPGLVGLLAHARPVLTKNDFRWEDKTELIAHLIPSPLEQTGVLATGAFPSIELRFHIEKSPLNKPQRVSAHPIKRDEAISTMLPNGKRIVFRDMRATIRTDAVQVDLPSHPVDIRFERRQKLTSRSAARDLRIKSFIEAVHESMVNDAALRAPPALQIPLPQWIVHPMNSGSSGELQQAARSLESQTSSNTVLVPVKYLFAGFEYREPRDFESRAFGPYYRARIETIEAGVTGGRRVELSLLLKHAVMDKVRAGKQTLDFAALTDASVDLVNLLAEIERGDDDSSWRSSRDLKSRPEKKKHELRRLRVNSAQWSGSRTNDPHDTSESKAKVQKVTQAPILMENVAAGGQAEDTADVEAPQLRVTDAIENSEMDKVAQQEQGFKLDTDHDPRVDEVPSSEQSSQEPIVVGEPEKRFVPDEEQPLQPADRLAQGTAPQTATHPEVVDSPTEKDQTVKLADGEESSTAEPTSSISEPPIQTKTSEQTLEQITEPEAEVTKDKEQTPEEEPLSVRLRRLMGQ